MSVKSHILDSGDYWGTSGFRWSDLELPATSIHFCAHLNDGNSGEDGQPATNHWSMYLETSPSSAVQIDIIANYPHDLPAMIVLASLNLIHDHESAHVVSCPLPLGVTVGSVLGAIIYNKRDQYCYNQVGEGCRFWLTNLADDFMRAGLIGGEVGERLKKDLGTYWASPRGSGCAPRAIVAGSFFK